MLSRGVSRRPGKRGVARAALGARLLEGRVVVATFLFLVGAMPVFAVDATRSVAAASAPQPHFGKVVSDFGVPEIALINSAMQKGWSDHNLAPSKQATDGEWCRRVYLDVIGRVPTVAELNTYLAD